MEGFDQAGNECDDLEYDQEDDQIKVENPNKNIQY